MIWLVGIRRECENDYPPMSAAILNKTLWKCLALPYLGSTLLIVCWFQEGGLPPHMGAGFMDSPYRVLYQYGFSTCTAIGLAELYFKRKKISIKLAFRMLIPCGVVFFLYVFWPVF